MPQRKPYEKQAVTNLQRYLRQLSYQDTDITPPPIDGIFEKVTQQSLIDFQTKLGLEPSGVADRITWNMLFAAYKDSIAFYSLPVQTTVFPRNSSSYALSFGDSSIYVVSLQYMLRELSRDYGQIFDLDISGEYDKNTEDAVKHFQLLNGILQTGKVDKTTWDRLAQAYNRRINEYHQ